MEEMVETDNLLNDDWIQHFEKTDELYDDFYKDDVYYTNLTFIYVNKNNEIEKVVEETFLLSKTNFIIREELLGILKKFIINNKINYKLLSILKYNITLDTEDVYHFLNKTDKNNEENMYLSVIKNIDTIFFEKTLNSFHDLNDVIFIFYEEDQHNSTSVNSNHTKTKRVHFQSLKKKKPTRRSYS